MESLKFMSLVLRTVQTHLYLFPLGVTHRSFEQPFPPICLNGNLLISKWCPKYHTAPCLMKLPSQGQKCPFWVMSRIYGKLNEFEQITGGIYWFSCQDFGSDGGTKVDSCKKLSEVSCVWWIQCQPAPRWRKLSLSAVVVVPLGIMFLRRKYNYCAEKKIAREERSEDVREEQVCRQQGQWTTMGRSCSKCWSKDSLAAHDPDHDEAIVPVKPMEIQQRSSCSPWKTPCWRRWMPERRMWPHGKIVQQQAPGRTFGPMEGGAHTGEGFLAGLLTPQGTHCWSSPILKDCMRWKAPMLEQFMKN